VQHELAPRVALNAGWYRRSFANQLAVDNELTDRNSYDGPFCITAPADSNLPNGGTYQVCDLFDIKPTFQGLVRNVYKLAKDFGGITDVYSGFDITVSARPRPGTVLQGGINAQRRHYDTCNAPLESAVPGITALAYTVLQVDNPENPFCDQTYPFRPDVKLLASHTLPFDVVVSGTYQFSRGVQNPFYPSVRADWPVPNAIIAPALRRNLSAGPTGTKTVNIIEPGTVYGNENLNQLDLRLSKRFKLVRYRFRIDADLYNALNNNWPYTVNNTFSTASTSAWLRPTNVLQARFFKIGAQFDF
jgi:hypothetical protein